MATVYAVDFKSGQNIGEREASADSVSLVGFGIDSPKT
jgi:hypothetical protein